MIGPQADRNLGIKTSVNGIEMSPAHKDTSAATTDTVQYVVTDSTGLTSITTRTDIIKPSPDQITAVATTASDTPSNVPATTTAAASMSTDMTDASTITQ